MDYRALMRRRLLEEMYDRLSDEEKQMFVQMSMQDKDHAEIMQSLKGLSQQVDRSKHSFTSDLIANVSGNAIFDGVAWLVSRLIKKF